MTSETKNRIEFLTTCGAVLNTLRGCRARVGEMDLFDLMLLGAYFDCTIDRMPRRLFHEARRRRRERRRSCPQRK